MSIEKREFGEFPPDLITRKQWDDATRQTHDYFVSLFRGPIPCGCGTLVSAGGKFGILTADHVLKAIFRSSELPRELTLCVAQFVHRFDVSFDWLEPLSIGEFDYGHAENGPDLAFIKIVSPSVLSTLGGKKSFYPLNEAALEEIESLPFESWPWFVLGAPKEKQEIAPSPGSNTPAQYVQHLLSAGEFADKEDNGDFDYVRVSVPCGIWNYPTCFEGVSGGGAWIVPLSIERNGDPKSLTLGSPLLVGVAFYQDAPDGNYRVLRLHGPRSIHQVAKAAISSPSSPSKNGCFQVGVMGGDGGRIGEVR